MLNFFHSANNFYADTEVKLKCEIDTKYFSIWNVDKDFRIEYNVFFPENIHLT